MKSKLKEGIFDVFKKFKVGSSVYTPDGVGVIDEIHGKTAVVDLMKGWAKTGKGRKFQKYDVRELELLESSSFLTKLTEGSYKGDLQRLVTPELHIDQHRSKMGEDDDVIVVSFKIQGKEPSQDLVNFLETGYDFILDADASPGEISPGKFLVFFELSRRTTAPERIYQIVEEVLNLSLQKMDEWRFAYGAPAQRGTRRKFTTYPLTLENLKSKIPMSPREYRDSHEEPQDTDDIAAMKNIAQIPVNQTAPDDDEMNELRQAAGTL